MGQCKNCRDFEDPLVKGLCDGCTMEKVDRARITELYLIIHSANKEIEEIRSECPHTSHRCEMYMWRPGGFFPSRICLVCDKPLNGITEQESAEIWRKFNEANPTTSGSSSAT